MRKFLNSIFIILCFLAISSTNAQSAGDVLFSSPNIHEIRIYFTQPNWYDSLVYYKPLDVLMMGKVKIDGTIIDSVGIQFKGNSSYNNPSVKKPFNIDFNEFVSGQNYDNLHSINLNNGFKDPTMQREKLFLDFCNSLGIAAPRCTYTNVFVNDTLWGFYTLVEQVSKPFLTNVYNDNNGNLFKGDPNGTLQWMGNSTSSYYNNYELKTNTNANDWTDLVHLIDKINNTPTINFHDSLETVLNSDSWIKAWAANTIFVNLDSYTGSGHNYYIYHNPISDRFHKILWDANEAFGNFNMGMNVAQIEGLDIFFIPSPSNSRPLTNNMLLNSAYKQAYINTLCDYVTHYFSNALFDSKIDSIANRIRSYYYADPHKMYPTQGFEDNLTNDVPDGPFTFPGLKSFITNRRNSLSSQLATNGCFTGIEEYQNSLEMVAYPNPFTSSITLTFGNKELTSGYEINVFDTFGKQVRKGLKPAGNAFIVSKENLPAGLYYYQLRNNSLLLSSGKIIVD